VLLQSIRPCAHPGKTILIRNVDDDLFWSSVYYLPFRLFGWNDILLTPDSRSGIKEDPAFPPLDSYFLTLAAATASYAASIDSGPPSPIAAIRP